MYRLRVGIVGLGRIAPAYIRAVQACGDLAELTAFVTRRRAAGRAAAEQRKVKKLYAELDEALASGNWMQPCGARPIICMLCGP